MRYTGPLNVLLEGDRDKAAEHIGTARKFAGALSQIMNNDARVRRGQRPISTTALRRTLEDGTEIIVRYFMGQWSARIAAPGVEAPPIGISFYPLFTLRTPADPAYNSFLFLDRGVYPKQIDPLGWRTRPLIVGESAGSTDWIGHNQRHLSWSVADGFGNSSVNNARYFYNSAFVSLPGGNPSLTGTVWYNGSTVFGVSNLLGACITTVADGPGGEALDYIYYLRYNTSPGRVTIHRRRFDTETGVAELPVTISGAPVHFVGAGDRFAGPFHFNASGTVAKGICTEDDGGGTATDIRIVTFSINPVSGTVTLGSEAAVTQSDEALSGTNSSSLRDVIASDTPGRYLFRLDLTASGSRIRTTNAIIAVDWVGDSPVYLRFYRQASTTTTATGINVFPRITGPAYSLGTDDYTLVPGVTGSELVDSTDTTTQTFRLTVEGAYALTLVDELASMTITQTRTGIRGSVDEDTVIHTYNWAYEQEFAGDYLRHAGDIIGVTSGGTTQFDGLDLRTGSYVFRGDYHPGQSNSVAGTQDDATLSLARQQATAYKVAFADRHSGYDKPLSASTPGFNISATNLLAVPAEYNENTGSGSASSSQTNTNALNNLSDIFFFDRNVASNMATLLLEPGVDDAPYVILYAYYDTEQSHAGLVSNLPELERSENRLRTIQGLGDPLENELANQMRPVRFAGFNRKADASQAPFKPPPNTDPL